MPSVEYGVKNSSKEFVEGREGRGITPHFSKRASFARGTAEGGCHHIGKGKGRRQRLGQRSGAGYFSVTSLSTNSE
jgi:hypothetical protein